MCRWFPAAGDEGELVGHLGPDLLGPDWDPIAAVGPTCAVIRS